MSLISGLLVFDGPVYRGNAKKTIFTRGNGKGDITLPGRIGGSAQAMMSAFTGFWQSHKNPKNNNYGLLEQLWKRLYGDDMPKFILNVSCTLDEHIANSDSYFDLRMGIAIDRDRMAQAKDQNFRLETVYKGSRFNFSLSYDENQLNKKDQVRFAFLIEEMAQGRFWFGAQKSTGLGNCHLVLDEPSRQLVDGYKEATEAIQVNDSANYVFIHLTITPDKPLLVSWPWGKKDDQGNRDSWVDALVKDTQDHQNVMKQVLSGKAHTWDDVRKLSGGSKFESTHLRRGEPMDLGQLKKNFPKAVQNDDTLTNFLQGHRERVHSEIDREVHQDFRENDGKISRGKPYDQLFYRSLSWNGSQPEWELCIPGNTIKGALRTKAQQILRTLHNGKGCKEKTSSHLKNLCDDKFCPVCSLFGRQGLTAKVFCSDAYPVTETCSLDDEHLSYDQIAIDPKTGKSFENSKLNFLYAYGQKFSFRTTLVLKDLKPQDMGQLGFLMFLIRELQNGNLPIGGKKMLDFGHVKGDIDKIEFLCAPDSPLENNIKKWDGQFAGKSELWQAYELTGGALWNNKPFTADISEAFSKLIGQITVPKEPYKTKAGYVSHRQYSALCGSLIYEVEAVTPLHIKESGEPSFQSEEAPGYDFFSLSPPKNEKKQPMNAREYVIPSSTLKGAVRNIYNLISANSCSGCTHINNLCDTCRLFGWVGKENNAENALMGRLKFSFARPTTDLYFEWYGAAFGYKGIKSYSVAGNRIIPHTAITNTAISRHGTAEQPNNLKKNITLNRFAAAGSRFQFQVDFTNLEQDEFNKILWAIALEDSLAHKMGKSKALGFGSCKIRLKDAYIIFWDDRFSSLTDLGYGQLNIEGLKSNPKNFTNYQELRKALALPK